MPVPKNLRHTLAFIKLKILDEQLARACQVQARSLLLLTFHDRFEKTHPKSFRLLEIIPSCRPHQLLIGILVIWGHIVFCMDFCAW
jgi:hypothetical protein